MPGNGPDVARGAIIGRRWHRCGRVGNVVSGMEAADRWVMMEEKGGADMRAQASGERSACRTDKRRRLEHGTQWQCGRKSSALTSGPRMTARHLCMGSRQGWLTSGPRWRQKERGCRVGLDQI
jgi:hypothetical protein